MVATPVGVGPPAAGVMVGVPGVSVVAGVGDIVGDIVAADVGVTAGAAPATSATQRKPNQAAAVAGGTSKR